jgi:hypothetical protein
MDATQPKRCPKGRNGLVLARNWVLVNGGASVNLTLGIGGERYGHFCSRTRTRGPVCGNRVVPSGWTPQSSPSRWACRAGSDDTARAIAGYLGVQSSRVGQRPDRDPVMPGVHPVSVIFDLVKPVDPSGGRRPVCSVAFDPTAEGHRLGAPPSRDRSCHCLRHDSPYRRSIPVRSTC